MTTRHYNRYTTGGTGARVPAEIIDIQDYRRAPVRHTRRKKSSDNFWNMVFMGLCLSVLVVLFFH